MSLSEEEDRIRQIHQASQGSYIGRCNSSRCPVHGVEASAREFLIRALDEERERVQSLNRKIEEIRQALASVEKVSQRADGMAGEFNEAWDRLNGLFDPEKKAGPDSAIQDVRQQIEEILRLAQETRELAQEARDLGKKAGWPLGRPVYK